MTFHFSPAARPLTGIHFDCNVKPTLLSPGERPEGGCRSRAREQERSDHIWRGWALVAARKINRVCSCKWPYLYQHAKEGPNVLHWRKWLYTHVGAGPAVCGWHKPKRCFVGWQLGVSKAAAILSAGVLELCALQAVLQCAAWLSSTGGKGVLLWHPPPLWQDPQPPHCWTDPWERCAQNPNLLVQHLAAERLMDQSGIIIF